MLAIPIILVGEREEEKNKKRQLEEKSMPHSRNGYRLLEHTLHKRSDGRLVKS